MALTCGDGFRKAFGLQLACSIISISISPIFIFGTAERSGRFLTWGGVAGYFLLGLPFFLVAATSIISRQAVKGTAGTDKEKGHTVIIASYASAFLMIASTLLICGYAASSRVECRANCISRLQQPVRYDSLVSHDGSLR
jgi:hypothetical protein